MRLQTIEFPSESICSSEEMYFHRQKNQLDFDGYFNLFYIEKRKKYCSLGGLKLVIRLKGASEIRLMHNRRNVNMSLNFLIRTLRKGYSGFRLGQSHQSILRSADTMKGCPLNIDRFPLQL